LARRVPSARILIVDPNTELGLGLAYSTPSLQHLLNVPAGKMSALAEEPDHFLNWLRSNYDEGVTPDDFVPRAVFGKYVQSLAAGYGRLKHLKVTVVDCTLENGLATLTLAGGSTLKADAVILALGNFDPPALNGRRYASAWDNATYQHLPENAPVALIGSGLTAIDVLLRFREIGHRGVIHAISRHATLPHRHAPYTPLTECVIPPNAPRTARQLLRMVHNAINRGLPWRAVIDSLRSRTNEIWLNLPVEEQRRFKRHLQRRWDVVRHRMAPAIADHVDAELAAGTFVVHRGSLELLEKIKVARVINCTGPNMNYRKVDSLFLAGLFAQGLVSAGPLGTGLATNRHGALQARDGSFSSKLFYVGPGRQGTLLEAIAVPELREQAARLAVFLAGRLNRERWAA
jgi:hydroxyacylglutathione hydrolase